MSKISWGNAEAEEMLLIRYYNRVFNFPQHKFSDLLLLKPEPCFCCIQKDINPTYDSSVSNHNKNQFSNLDIGSRFSAPVRGRVGTRKTLQFFNPSEHSGPKAGVRIERWKMGIKIIIFQMAFRMWMTYFLFTHQLGHHFHPFFIDKNGKQIFVRVSLVAEVSWVFTERSTVKREANEVINKK